MSLESMAAKVEEVTNLVTALGADLAYLQQEPDSQRKRRSFVRGFFALVEGTVFGLKGVLLEASALFGSDLAAGEQAMLVEEVYQLQDGEVRVTQPFIKVADNVRFTFKLGARLFGMAVPVDYSGEGWAGFKQCVLVRNRLMHPKHPLEIDVSDAEIAALSHAIEWFKQNAVRLMLAARSALIQRRAELTAGPC